MATISARKLYTGAWCLSAVVNDRQWGARLVEQQYYYYTKRQALAEFRRFIRTLE